MYKTSTSFDTDVFALATVLDDADDSLLMAGCYQFRTDKPPDDYLPQDCYVASIGIYTNTFSEVREKVLQTLQSLASTTPNKRLSDNAYVILSQSPYMRDSNGNVITPQYNISSYNFELKVGQNLAETPLFIRMYIILPMYDRNLVKKTTPTDVTTLLLGLRTNKDQCFVKCIGDNTKSYCGCLNTNINASQPNSYTSSCSSTPDLTGDTNKSVNIPANFFIMYRVNPLSPVVAASNIFDH